MISKMSFGVSQVRDYLVANGCVLTVRGYDYRAEVAEVPELGGTRITRKKVCEIKTAADLQGFITLSGFEDVRDWWRQICQFAKGRKWLYRVVLIEGLSQQEIKNERREHEQMFAEQNAWSNEQEIADLTRVPEFDNRAIDQQTTSIEEYSVFSGQMSHPRDRIDDQKEFHDSFIVDLQPSRDAARSARLQREREQAEKKRQRMREQTGEQTGIIRKMVPTQNGQDILMITGNRKLSDPYRIRRELEKMIDDKRPDLAISGMAIGADQLFACICIDRGIPVHAYIPFVGQESHWPVRVQKRYKMLLSKCSQKIVVCDSVSKQAFQIRNAAMVKAATRAVAVWGGKPGGTANTIRLLNRGSMPYEVIENGTEA